MRTAIALLLCLIVAPAWSIDRGVSGIWSNPAQSGHGFEITVIDADTASVSWYTYNASGFPIWLTSVLEETAPGVLSGNASYLDGIAFGVFNSNTLRIFPWGTLRVSFASCDTAVVDYSGTLRYSDGSGFGTGTIPIRKLVGIPGVGCGGAVAPATLAGVYAGEIRSSVRGQSYPAYALLESNGIATITAPGVASYFGTWTGDATNAGFALVAQTVVGAVFPNGSSSGNVTGTATARVGDFVQGSYSGVGDAGTFSLTWLGLGTRPAATAAIAGTYADASGATGISATIGASGNLSGRDASGCTFNGTIAPLSILVNAYAVAVTVTSCGSGNGEYAGKAIAADAEAAGDGRALAVAIRGPSNSVSALLRRN